MSSPGADDLLVRSRRALLDVLDALEAHRDSAIVVGAQAIYLRTSSSLVALAEATKDSDVALDPRTLDDDPLIENAMATAGFVRDLGSGQPGAWLSSEGIPVDLMVPERLAGRARKNARGARIPPHDPGATRRARGLEAAIVDNDVMEVGALDPSDARRHDVRVAGPAALLIAKMHKLADRAHSSPHRLVDKDAHDVYRILVDAETDALARKFRDLREDEFSAEVTLAAQTHLAELFASSSEATGSMMAGRAEQGIGELATVSLQVSILAADLVAALP